MKFYIEVTLIDQSDLSIFRLWSKLYTQLHLALVKQQNPDLTVNYGVSFPEYSLRVKEQKCFGSLGSKLRVFANTMEELEELNLTEAFERLSDYVHLTRIKTIPENIMQYLTVKRYRAELNLEQITRRYARRKGISVEQAIQEQNSRFAELNRVTVSEAENHYKNPKVKDFPYIKLNSLSNGQSFSLFIEQKQSKKACKGTFSTYGLSSGSTVPHW